MRIWLLTSELPQEIAGGIARYVENFARILGSAGHEVTIIARAQQACDHQLAPGVRLIGVVPRDTRLHDANADGRPATHPAYPYNILSYWPALSYQMAEEVLALLQQLPRPDIIESQEYAALPYYLLQRKLTEDLPLRHIPLLVQLHSPTFELAIPNQEPRYRFPDYWVAQMERFCIAAADTLLAPSHYLTRRIKAAFSQPLEIATIPLPLLAPAAEPSSTVRQRHLVYVGRLELRKGVLPLVKACSRLWEQGEEFRLTLVGGDVDFFPRQTTVGAFIQQRYAKWIERGMLEVAGQVPHSQVLTYMREAWAVAVPSLWENFPNTCMEAMGVGQVVLASRHGGQAEMIETDGANGFLFDWQNVGEFAQQLHRVFALDENERLAIARQAQMRIRSLCDPAVVLPQRVQHYEQVIAQHRLRTTFPTINGYDVASTNDGDALNTTAAGKSRPAQEQANLLSVVIPFYNLGTYLEEALESVLTSSYSSREVIIVNDGSTDEQSLAVLRAIEARRLPNVRIVHRDNQGLALTRNTGAQLARGEFLAFVDADDSVEPTFFTQAIAVLHQYQNVMLVYSWVQYFGEATTVWPTWNLEFPYLLGHNMLTPLIVTRRAAFLEQGGNSPEFEYNFEDYEGWVALLKGGGVGVSLAQPLTRYRVRSGSMYQSANQAQLLYLYDVLAQRHPDLYRQWGAELFHLQNANGPSYAWNHPAQQVAAPAYGYVSALVQEREKLAAEVQTLGRAWEDHVRFIASQRAYIEDLETRCRELLTLSTNGSALAPLTNGITSREYEIGGQLVSRIKRTWIARKILQSSKLKNAFKKALRM